ncbi:MAG: 5-oxoprolinase subunit PxpA [Campylobacterales bacterium]|nr:5-oxoprolinase subunit PxpA [Campylobacterales bacterium]
MMKIKLNCDMGESFGIYNLGMDEKIMPYVDMVNLACGFHASDALTMTKTLQEVKKHNLEIGAHPAYQDLVGFGRRSMVCSLEEIKAIVLYQIGALSAICVSNDRLISYVKPHGALYNDMMKDENIFKAILSAISSCSKNLKLMILSSSKNDAYAKIALLYGISLLYEVFADRNYNDDGSLVSRSHPDAVIHDEFELMDRITLLRDNGYMYSVNKKKIFLKTDTICVHGDNDKALEFVKNIKKILD